MSSCGVYGTTAITALTAQNLVGVAAVEPLSADFVLAQVAAVTAEFTVRATKTGMLWSASIVSQVAELAPSLGALVVDPVMIATSGASLLADEAVEAYRNTLLERALVCTPNLDEAAALLERPAIGAGELRAVTEELYQRFGCAFLLKGGHLDGDPVDTLSGSMGTIAWRHPRVEGVNTHGSGCSLSAALASRLACGDDLISASEQAIAFVHNALDRSAALKPLDDSVDRSVRLADLEGGIPIGLSAIERLN